MERSHDLAKSGAAKLQVSSGGKRVPTGMPSTRQRADAVTPGKQRGSVQTRVELSGTESPKLFTLFRSTRGKLIGLVALLGLWGAIMLANSPSPDPPRVAAPRSVDIAGPRGPSAKAGAEALPRLKVNLLSSRREPYVPPTVTIFSEPPPPPPPVQAVQPVAPPSPPPPDPFVEASKQLRFVGVFKSDAMVAAIITQGTQLYIASGGDTVADRFRVVSVQDETVTLASPEGDKRVRLGLAAASWAAAPGAMPAPVMVAAPVFGSGVAQGESAGNVVDSESAAAKPTPVAGPLIRSRAERSEMYKALARTGQQ